VQLFSHDVDIKFVPHTGHYLLVRPLVVIIRNIITITIYPNFSNEKYMRLCDCYTRDLLFTGLFRNKINQILPQQTKLSEDESDEWPLKPRD